MAGKRVVARRPFDYQDLKLDRGSVFELRGARNDDRLLGYRFVDELEKGAKTVQCGSCGMEFMDESTRRAHGDKRHPSRPRNAEEEDRFLDREERLLEQVSPLALPTS